MDTGTTIDSSASMSQYCLSAGGETGELWHAGGDHPIATLHSIGTQSNSNHHRSGSATSVGGGTNRFRLLDGDFPVSLQTQGISSGQRDVQSVVAYTKKHKTAREGTREPKS